VVSSPPSGRYASNRQILEVMDRLKEILGAPPGGRGDSALVVGHGGEDREAWV